MLDIIENIVIMELTDTPALFEKSRGIQIAPRVGLFLTGKNVSKAANFRRLGTS